MTAPDPVLEAAVQALRNEGGGAGSSIHDWRCEYPDRYGPCACVEASAAEIVAAVRPLIEAEVREAVAREIEADPCAEHGEVGCPAVPCRRESGLASHYARIARGSNA